MITRRRIGSSGQSSSSKGWVYSSGSANNTDTVYDENSSLLANTDDPAIDLINNMNPACRDRTGEFQAVVKSLKSQKVNGIGHKGKNNALAQRSEFTQFSKRIGRDLSKTYEKLEKLTLLCKKRSLFDDRPVEIQELTYIIKQDVNSLNKKIAQLEQIIGRNRSKSDAHKHSSSIIRTLRSKLATMSDNFKHVLEIRRENLKGQKVRKDQYSSTTVSSSMPMAAAQGHSNSVLLMDEQRSSGDVSISMDGGSYNHETMQLVEQQDAYITERASTMETIESTIVELGQIFTQLATMVKEQEEQVLRIDANVEESELNIEAAHGEILKYFQGVTSNRWLMAKIFLVLIVFFVIFVVFFA